MNRVAREVLDTAPVSGQPVRLCLRSNPGTVIESRVADLGNGRWHAIDADVIFTSADVIQAHYANVGYYSRR